MPVPFRRQGKTRSAKRRTHQGVDQPSLVTCSNCGTMIKSHNICKKCGHYKNKQVIKVKENE